MTLVIVIVIICSFLWQIIIWSHLREQTKYLKLIAKGGK